MSFPLLLNLIGMTTTARYAIWKGNCNICGGFSSWDEANDYAKEHFWDYKIKRE